MAGRERHLGISPGFQAVTICRREAGSRDQLDEVGDLVDVAAVRRLPVAPCLP